MKRILTTSVVAGLLGTLGFAPVVSADATVYGSLRYGVQMSDDDTSGSSTSWNIGTNSSSRFGIRASADAMEGVTASAHIERNLDAGLSARHHNVSLSGGFGTVTFGQQSDPYYGAVTWDGAAHLGGGTDFGLRRQGAAYSSALGGPFDFSVFVSDGGAGGGADHRAIAGSFDFGPIALSLGYMQQVDDAERLGGTVGGDLGGVNWKVGYESATDLVGFVDAADANPDPECGAAGAICDADRYGFHLGYAVGGGGPGGGNAYVQFGERDSDSNVRDTDYWLFGYSHYVSESVTVDAVYRTQDTMPSGVDQTDSTAIVVVKVDF